MRFAPLLLGVVVVACGRQDARSVASYEVPIEAAPTEAPAPRPEAPCAADIVLGPGLEHERRAIAATKSPTSDTPCLDIVRADLATYRLRVLSSSRDGNGSHPAPWWRDTFHLVAVTNAGMFHEGGDPVGLVVEDGATLGHDNKKFSGYLAFDDAGNATIAGRDCPGFDLAKLRTQYRSVVQSGRLLGCNGEALPWKDKKQYSAAAIGLSRDRKQVVFLHARDAVTMTELATAVAELDLSGAIFLEGGPEASLVVRGAKSELSRVGSYETGFVENNENQSFWWLPNVIALETK
ncbi:MAG TPA: phosphodiester glycosidase family protein [Kofleriaceae bacterium]|nr:phosphodiester glycosidase family protein [Kofleriaceae bacterium]